MELIRKQGIVLGRRNFAEADVILDLLPESGPPESVKAHGIRASRKRSQIITEPGSRVALVYYRGKNGPGSLKEGEVLERFQELKSSYENSLLLAYILELTAGAAWGNEGSALLQLLEGALRALQERRIDLRERPSDESSAQGERIWLFELLGFYKTRLLSILGLLGDCEHCSLCGEELGRRACWPGPLEVSFTCEKCSPEAGESEAWQARAVSLAQSRKFARFLEFLPPAPEDLLEATRALDLRLGRALEAQFTRPPASRKEFYGRALGSSP